MARDGENKWVNSFTAGLFSDFDASAQPPNTYRESINGRVFFNESTGSLTWTNALGNKSVFTLSGDYGASTGYYPLGTVEFTDYLVILSFNQTNSEIGFATLDPLSGWSYQTAYNDKYDPNGGLLNFKMYVDVQSIKGNVENDAIQRIYWTNGVDMDKVFNMKEGLKKYTPQFVDGDYRPLVSTGKYPPFYSAFSMDSTPDFQPGLIKYVQSISGEKLVGVYQYVYRLVTKDGYKTPFTFPIKHIFLTSDVVQTNSQKYAMQVSQSPTSKGIQLQITGIDTRYYQMEVCYIYSIAPSQSLEANIFATVNINGQSTIVVNDISNRGTPVALTEILTETTVPLTVKDLAVKQKRLFKGGITVAKPATVDTSLFTAIPFTKSMVADQNDITGQANPFVNTNPYTTQTAISKYVDNTSTTQSELFGINTDYINYKGTQVEHLYGGYFREEWYRIGILLFDKKGYPMFVNFIMDIKLPSIGGNTYTTVQIDSNGNPQPPVVHTLGSADDYNLTTNGSNSGNRVDFANPTNTIRTRILGLMVSNIDLTSVINDISGFSIVRVERDPTIFAQGLLLNTVSEAHVDNVTSTDYNTTRPMGYPSNFFDGNYKWFGLNSSVVPIDGRDGNANNARQKTFTYECPDYIFDNTVIPTVQNNHVLRSIGGCWMEGLSGDNRAYGYTDFGVDGSTRTNDRLGLINKTYYTSSQGFLDLNGNPITFGYNDGVDFYVPFGQGTVIKGYDPSNSALELDGVVELNTQFSDPSPLVNNRRYQGVYHNEALLIKSTTLPESSCTRASGQFLAYRLVNYVQDGKTPYGGVNADSLAQSIYIPTGHFQVINDTVKAQVLSGGKYIFNNVEVWGGDCYVNLYGMSRVIGSGDHTSNMHNIAIGNVFPCEMKYNAALRKGNTWQKSGFVGYNGSGDIIYPDGITALNPEDDLINNVLLYGETNALTEGVPLNQNFQTDFGDRYIYSPPKIDGEPVDNWRKFPVNQFDDMEGLYGRITGSFELGDNVYCIQERGFGRLRILDRIQSLNPVDGALTLGFGGVLDSIQYINMEYGCQHEISIVNTSRSAYWVDARKRAICRFSQNGFEVLSDVHGLHNEMNALFTNQLVDFSFDNPTLRGGIFSTYDSEKREIVFHFVNNPVGSNPKIKSLGFSEVNEAFTSHYDWIPTKTGSLGQNLISFNSLSGTFDFHWYQHNIGDRGNYFGVVHDSILQYSVNAKIIRNLQQIDHGETRIFGVLEISGNNSIASLKRIDFQTDEVSDNITMPDSRVRYRESRIWMPTRGISTTYRQRGVFMLTKLTFSNIGNPLVLIRSAITSWRNSHK